MRLSVYLSFLGLFPHAVSLSVCPVSPWLSLLPLPSPSASPLLPPSARLPSPYLAGREGWRENGLRAGGGGGSRAEGGGGRWVVLKGQLRGGSGGVGGGGPGAREVGARRAERRAQPYPRPPPGQQQRRPGPGRGPGAPGAGGRRDDEAAERAHAGAPSVSPSPTCWWAPRSSTRSSRSRR